MTWHKFETAPKDGSVFHARVKTFPFIVEAKYFEKSKVFKIRLVGRRRFVFIKQGDFISWTGKEESK